MTKTAFTFSNNCSPVFDTFKNFTIIGIFKNFNKNSTLMTVKL